MKITKILLLFTIYSCANTTDLISRKHCCNAFPGAVGPQGFTGQAGLPGINYLFAFSSQEQDYALTAPALQDITFNNVAFSDGWLHPDPVNFTCPATGIYLVFYRACTSSPGPSQDTNANPIQLVALFNNVQINGSASSSVEAFAGASTISTVSASFLINAVVGQQLKLQFTNKGTVVSGVPERAQLIAATAVGGSTTVELTIIRIR